MNPDPASLENLRDIVVPPLVTWWPPASGWWAVFAALTVVVMIALLRAFYRWKANAYRRAALQELRSANEIAEIAEILKRTALYAYPRTEIASLSGSAWCQWLGEIGAVPLPDKVAKTLTDGVFGNVHSVEIEQISAFATEWITHHRNRTEARKGRKEG